ncbi:MAG: hypothetical protein ACI959_002260 [Limisphaerales bacterium]|jgi:hypothetical protein
MQSGICTLSSIPVRKEPGDASEMVSQLLFGEYWLSISEEEKWIMIRMTDGYEGWIDRKQATFLPKPLKHKDLGDLTERIKTIQESCSLDLVQSATSKDRHIPLLIGSSLPQYDGMSFNLLGEKFVYNGGATDAGQPPSEPAQIVKISLKYLGAPYLWGGRSPFGIDCSGFVQVVYKIAGYQLPRDAWQQAGEGLVIEFVHAAREGDLAFFDNEEGRITHVGIVMADQKIIHASGKVRIDTLDHYGIFDPETKRYTHKLRVIKRIQSASRA